MSFTAGQFPLVLKIAELFPGQDNVFKTTLLACTLRSDGLVVKSLHSQTRDPVFTTTGWLQGRFSPSSYRGRSNEHQEFLGT